MSCSAIVAPANSGSDRMSVSRFLTKTTLPAPIIAIFKRVLLVWKRMAFGWQIKIGSNARILANRY
jgi:hypothetical protein